MSDNLENKNDISSDNFSDNVVSGVEQAPKKKKGLKAAAIGVGAVVVIAGAGTAAYNLSDYVKNQVKLATLKPAEYYSWVTEKYAEETSDSISKAYKKYIDELNDGTSSNLSLKYEASDEVKELLLDEIFGTGFDAGESEETQMLSDVINGINSVEVGVDAAVKNSVLTGSVYGSFNDEKIISADVAIDYDELAYYLRVPELKEQWLGMSLAEVMGMSGSNNEVVEAMQEMMKNPEEFITPEELSELISKYAAVWCEEIDDVELEKKEKINIGDISVEYTVITAEIDGKKAQSISKAFVKKISKDKLIKEIVTERLGVCTEDDFDLALEEALADIEDGDFAGDETIEFVTYVDPKGTIRGMSLTVEDEEVLNYIIGLEDDNVYGELVITDGYESVSVELNAVKDGNTYTGDLDFKTSEGTISVEFDDFEIVDDEKCYVNGELSVIIPDVDPISLSLSSDGKSQDIAFVLDIDGANYGKVTLSWSTDKAGDVSLPNADDAFMIDFNSLDFDIEDYITEADIESFISGICEKLGIEKSYADMIAESAVSSMYSSGDYYDDYDYDYDYDWDYDDYDWDYDDYDYDYSDSENPDAANAVNAESGEAYINVMDDSWDAEYWGYDDDNLAYNAGVAKINGNGQYTVSVTADTDGYRYDTTGDVNNASVLPQGIDYLSVCIDDGDELFPNAIIKIDSVKIDGKEYAVSGDNFTSLETYSLEALVYSDWYTPRNPVGDTANTATTTIIDGASVQEWTTIEITFTVSGV